MSRDETQLLARSVSACRERIASLQYSVAKNSPVFPLSLDSLKNISEDQKESIDAMTLRYSQCVSMIQDQLFNLEKAFHPRKARKSRNKSINYIMSVNHPSGDSLENAMHLNLFVFFRVVRGQLIF